MKSMQPYEYEEEVARSAERSAKRRRREEEANRFKLLEESTPTSSSPSLVLVPETQGRSPVSGMSTSLHNYNCFYLYIILSTLKNLICHFFSMKSLLFISLFTFVGKTIEIIVLCQCLIFNGLFQIKRVLC